MSLELVGGILYTQQMWVCPFSLQSCWKWVSSGQRRVEPLAFHFTLCWRGEKPADSNSTADMRRDAANCIISCWFSRKSSSQKPLGDVRQKYTFMYRKAPKLVLSLTAAWARIRRGVGVTIRWVWLSSEAFCLVGQGLCVLSENTAELLERPELIPALCWYSLVIWSSSQMYQCFHE